MIRTTLSALFAVSCLLTLGACDESVTDAPDPSSGQSGSPWTRQFTFGNFALNSAPVTTNQDGVSDAYLTDYVEAGKLPSANFEFFSVNAYLPYAAGTDITVESATVKVARTDGSSTGDIFRSAELVQNTTVSGEEYAVFQVQGFTTKAPAITPSSFANVVFELQVTYTQGGSEAARVVRTVEVYKR